MCRNTQYPGSSEALSRTHEDEERGAQSWGRPGLRAQILWPGPVGRRREGEWAEYRLHSPQDAESQAHRQSLDRVASG